MDLYRELILDHYKHPRNFGHLEKPDVVVEEGNVTCGDRIVMEIKSKVESRKSKVIEAIRFNGEGCAISQASASMLTEKVKGMKLLPIKKMSVLDIETMLGVTLTPSRVKCATLPLEVLHKAIATI
ncbi:MAG: iron-sulfur cluster assembly scaffold protein [Candidatus Gottesmanbacteria bacterium]|nr:iron-sulfur cluster assembly scaffold protein [Candidatus Gottesmanbacteria bacterium]